MNPIQLILIGGVQFYRCILSPAKAFVCGPFAHCRFVPSCSQYALTALQGHGSLAGTGLAVRRICRCHPWGGGGFDPVPPVPPQSIKVANCFHG